MKHILIILMAFTVSASVQAQTKTLQPVKTAPAIRDTVFSFNLTLSQTKALLSCMETTLTLLPRSADLTALQASEAQKQVYVLGKLITDQLPKVSAPKDSVLKK